MTNHLFPFLFLTLLKFTTSLTWEKHQLPISGELVLTDIHAIVEDSRIIALASGEEGVLLKLDIPVTQTAPFIWATLLDVGPPVYWYGAYLFSSTSYLISGFLDGSNEDFGVVAFSDDGGKTWGNDTKIDPCGKADCAWAGGPIEFANLTEGFLPSTSGQSAWRTQTGGRNASEWIEIIPSDGNWHAGNYIYDKEGLIRIAGSNDCTSLDFAETWNCRDSWDESGIDSAIACSGVHCLVGGGEISPTVSGWIHLSNDGGSSFSQNRSLLAAFPIRSVQAITTTKSVNPIFIAAGGNFFSAQGGIYSSIDGGVTWNLDINLGEEVKACRTLNLNSSSIRVFCVTAGSTKASIVSSDILL
jgi:hypothetical protein